MYSSVYEYLDKHLPNRPSDMDIVTCKRAYWKWYRKNHRKTRVASAKALNLTISRELWNDLRLRAKASSLNIYDYIKEQLKHSAEANLEMNRIFGYELMLCFESIKDYMHGDISLESLHNILEQILLKL